MKFEIIEQASNEDGSFVGYLLKFRSNQLDSNELRFSMGN